MPKFFIRFLKFFLISLFLWFVITPSVSYLQITIALCVALVCGVILSIALNFIFYKHILNFFGYFSKIGFYKYLAFMVKEIWIATYQTLKSALNFKKPYQSQILHITLPKETTVDKALIVALSIIMTPGTTIINIEGKKMAVHCLTQSAHSAMVEMSFVKKVLSFNF